MPDKKAYQQLLTLFSRKRSLHEWDALLRDILTPQELESLTERWQLVQLLDKGIPQRDIAKRLGISMSKITRGSRVLLDGAGGFHKALKARRRKK